MTLFDRLRAYPANDDPRAAACNIIAMVVAWNQPFYPLYVWWLVGGPVSVTCWTFLSTPLFVAVPFVARRHGLLGRALLPIAGIANTLLSAKAFGTASGVAWFLLACTLIALLAFRRREWIVPLTLLVAIAVAWLIHDRLGMPLGAFTPDQYRHFTSLNQWSVATLCLCVAWTLGRAAWDDQVRPASLVVTR